jgi:hypothetical protein
VSLTKESKTQNLNYTELPQKVQDAYYRAYTRKKGKPDIINLDSSMVKFRFVRNSSIEIIKEGKEIYKIGNRKFYIPWNYNKEIGPYLLHEKIFYGIVGNNESWNTHTVEQLERNQFFKVDLSRYLRY